MRNLVAKFLILFWIFLLGCKPKQLESKVASDAPILDIGTEALSEKLLCSLSVKDRIQQIKLVANDMRSFCHKRQKHANFPIQCESGCIASYSKEQGFYTNLEVKMVAMNLDNLQLSSGISFEWTPPTEVDNHTLQCVDASLEFVVESLYSMYFDTVCTPEPRFGIYIPKKEPEPSTTASNLGEPIEIDHHSYHESCGMKMLNRINQEFEEGLKSTHKKKTFDSSSTQCQAGTYEDFSVGFTKSNKKEEQVVGFAFGAGEDWRFTIYNGFLERAANFLQSKSKFKLSHASICYPLSAHPAKKALKPWILENWNKLLKQEQCPRIPPPAVLF